MTEKILTIEEENQGLRLDVFLARNLGEGVSRTFVRGLIDAGQVTLMGTGVVNAKKVSAHHKVSVGDNVIVQIPQESGFSGKMEPEDIPLDIFYEDKILLVINKPAGLLVHPAHGRYSGTLVNALLHYSLRLSNIDSCPGQPGQGEGHQMASFRPGIVHRLDRETSGLMLIARDDRTHGYLARQFERHRVKKRYVALVKGDIEFDEGVIDAPLGRHPRHWDKRGVSFDAQARDAKTFYRVLKRFNGLATRVALFPVSGRTHQLRVHMAYLGYPILGDNKYGNGNSFPRLGLHAQGIGFHYPGTKQYVEFSSPVPGEFLNPLPLIKGDVDSAK